MRQSLKILIVEDEPSLCGMMQKELLKEGHDVEQATTFAQAQEKLSLCEYDCVLLDIMLPGGSGLDLLRRMKEEGRKEKVIIISAKDSIDDKVLGLDLGADDYLPKPFYLVELMARIRSVARRSGSKDRGLTLGNVRLDPDSQSVAVEGRELVLLKKEFSILAYFMQRSNHLIDKVMLAEAVWGDHADQSDTFNFLYSQIKNLKRKLYEAGATIEIKAVYGFGYKLVQMNQEPGT